MRKVLVVKSELLRYSETFIREQVSAYTRWEAVLVGERHVPGVSLDGLNTKFISAAPLTSKVASYLGVPHWGHVKAMRSERAALIHVHFGTEAVKFWPALQQLELPVVVTLHGSDINIHFDWWEKHGGLVGKKYPARLLALGRDQRVRFIAVSEATRQRAISVGLPAERIQVKPIGVDTAKFTPLGPDSPKNRRVLYVGRLVEKKGARYLIEAFEQVCREVVGAELLLIGDGPLRDELKAKASGLPVIFAGRMTASQVQQQLQRASVLCLPSIVAENGDAEGLPIALLEAQATGIPVVTSALGGALEGIIHGKTGFATPPKDSGAIAEALIAILRDESRARSMGAAARAYMVERFDIRRCTAKLEDYYDEIVSRRLN